MLIVDAENVRRSVWPNVSREELVRLCGAYAQVSGEEVAVVFDGAVPDVEPRARVALVASGARSADDVIAERAAASGGAVTVVTSDRALRGRLPDGVGTVGGGAFVRQLLDL